ATDLATHGLWGRIAATVGRRHRFAWIGALVVLGICLIGLTSLKTNGMTTAQGFTSKPDAVKGQQIYDAKFSDPGAGVPAVITANADKANDVIAAASKVGGVAPKPGSVSPQIDYAKVTGSGVGINQATGCAPAAMQVSPV